MSISIDWRSGAQVLRVKRLLFLFE